MRVKYLGNSGFAVAVERQLFVFDDISKGAYVRKETLVFFDNVYVFATHAHRDHYDPDIFKMSVIRDGKVKYILSGDIIDSEAQTIPSVGNIHRMDEGMELELDNLHIRAFGSTDLGVSFDITIPHQGRKVRIFHAGDLNNWHWRNENNADWTSRQEKEFDQILETIPKEPRIDLAFFPFDPKMGDDYARGAIDFVNKFAPAMIVPMHFGQVWNEPDNFAEEAGNKSLLCPLSALGASFDAMLT